MKIPVKTLDYDAVMALPRMAHKPPRRPALFFRALMAAAGAPDLRDARFTWSKRNLEAAGDGPWLVLMNHSAFIDLEIASRLLFPRPFCIVCTSDGFVGKEWLMRRLGCIPTQKFVSDLTLIRDMQTALHDKRTSVLMYPEASYTFDGTATPLPRRLGALLKRLDVPVVMIRTWGAFARDPLYNCLQKRRVAVRAEMSCLLSREEIASAPVEALDARLDEAFTFDNFAWQREEGVRVTEPFRADGLNRILYKCARCGREGGMKGAGVRLTCAHCGAVYEMDELGQLAAADGGATEFPHIPDWYAWERAEVRREIEDGVYRLDVPVKIGMMVDTKAIYMVGEGRLVHDADGFVLTGCGGRLRYVQSPRASYGLYADYYWYEIGDMISIGNHDALYYCFPQGEGDVVAKTRLAAEELYRRTRRRGGSAAGQTRAGGSAASQTRA